MQFLGAQGKKMMPQKNCESEGTIIPFVGEKVLFYLKGGQNSGIILLVRINLWNFLSSPHGTGYPKLAKEINNHSYTAHYMWLHVEILGNIMTK